LGFDIRQSQVALGERRLADVRSELSARKAI